MKLNVSADNNKVTLQSSRFNLCLDTGDDHIMVTVANEGTELRDAYVVISTRGDIVLQGDLGRLMEKLEGIRT